VLPLHHRLSACICPRSIAPGHHYPLPPSSIQLDRPNPVPRYQIRAEKAQDKQLHPMPDNGLSRQTQPGTALSASPRRSGSVLGYTAADIVDIIDRQGLTKS
jgi:hypothetical protein